MANPSKYVETGFDENGCNWMIYFIKYFAVLPRLNDVLLLQVLSGAMDKLKVHGSKPYDVRHRRKRKK